MELLGYALLKPLVPFVIVMALAAVGWLLSETAARRLTGNERTFWAFAILVLPPLGNFLYGIMGKKGAADPEVGRSW